MAMRLFASGRKRCPRSDKWAPQGAMKVETDTDTSPYETIIVPPFRRAAACFI
jgi:hypothetical protein